ncbi:MAG: cytochrome b [Pseudomonadota bacterium]|uniref:cytochrome b n=1 Tax=Sphingomonas sp. ERG5 TaxID=1381597 RepID=UPI00054C09C1|nr:cytochrome b [Sphingomonas sp. ERG5]
MDPTTAIDSPAVAEEVQRHDAVSMTLHWLTLLLLIVLFWTAWAREEVSDGDTAALLLTVHRSTGVLIWAVTLFRLAWKTTAARTPALPSGMPRAQRWAARASEVALYLILVAQPITGFVQSIARGKPLPLLGLSVPAVMARDEALTHLFHDIHETTATVLLVLVGLHACAALLHGIVLRDGVFSSMLPARKRSTEE